MVNRLYTAEDIRQLDQLAITQQGISAYELMCRAAESAWRHLLQRWPELDSLIVVCGGGHNAGDGYVLARLAIAAGINVSLLQLSDSTLFKGDVLTAYNDFVAVQGVSEVFNAETQLRSPSEQTVLVDALLGTGLTRPVEGLWLQAVQLINQSGLAVLAMDIPSGLDADTGCELGTAVKADMTVTFIGAKQGMYTANGRDCCGKIILDCLGLQQSNDTNTDTDSVCASVSSDLATVKLLNKSCLKKIGPRWHSSHKGCHGHVLVVGGIAGFSGAVFLAAMAAMRVGAGLVSIATDPFHAALLDTQIPEVMCHAVSSRAELKVLLTQADVIVVGPGLGQQDWSRLMLEEVIQCEQPLVIDADALNLIGSDVSFNYQSTKHNRIMTPHPGEAATLLSASSAEVQQNRFASVIKLVERYQSTFVLKGSGSLVTPYDAKKPATTWVCPLGNPGMATAGMGDILSGVIASLLAQGLSVAEASKAGVLVHAYAGDLAATMGQRGLIASDLLSCLRTVVNNE
ncbi:NAD(P)H-hydrate epimerase / ADP-dependent (S)-NAD(P)H-hydrate dehydratase [hydrothermal vent metagenome]|uniref:Nicotinamide nucleotide repair protein n=1 Tax=hydrothermal vent metagenome TaxID=652676 RepID=A0A3B0YGN7_9ZZZZ